jgi:hypothetical protein
MNEELPIYKEKAIRFGFPWVINHFLLFILSHLREIVHELNLILAVWDTIGKLKLEI